MASKKGKPILDKRTVTYKRAAWKQGIKYFGVVLIILLNISFLASMLNIQQHHRHFVFAQEIFVFMVVLFFDISILFPIVLEADEVTITPDYLVVRTLFWRSKIAWQKIVSFEKPIYLSYAILRTPKFAYLINKRDIKPFEELVETIQFKRSKACK